MQRLALRQAFDLRYLLLALAAAVAAATIALALLARVGHAAPVSAITFGQTVTGTLALAGQTDTYSFAGNAGDAVISRLARTCCTLYPRIRLYAPGGALLADSGSNVNYGRVEIDATLLTNGTYTLMASGGDSTSTGDYSLSLQRLNNPGNATALTYNHVISETVSSSGEIDTYTFVADAGDVVLSRMARSCCALHPQLRLYAPDGRLLKNSGYNIDYGRVEITSTLTVMGKYTLLASDGDGVWNPGSTGIYSLSLQHLNNPGDNPGSAAVISFGQTIAGLLSASGQTDAFTFVADAGGVVLSRMARSCCGLYPQIRLYAPNGALLRNSGYNIDFASKEITSTLPTSGSYTLIASDGDGVYNPGSTGTYGLSLQCLTGVCYVPAGKALYLPLVLRSVAGSR